MAHVTAETVRVFRGGKRRRLTIASAYNDAARVMVRRRYPCECEQETHFYCGHNEAEKRLVPRLARFLRFVDDRTRRDRKIPTASAP